MNRSVLGFVMILLISSCGQKKLSQETILNEKKAIETVAVEYSKAIKEKNTQGTLDLFSNSLDFLFIGTDSAEVFKNKDSVKSHLEVDWQLLELIKVGDLKNVSIQISKDGELASMIYEVPWDMKFAGQMMHALVRFAMTMTKENGKWYILNGLGQMATVGQSSEDLLKQIKESPK